ncbi:MAG: transporter substrate-binding domain-containing protein [Desulfarculus sp.]|nr:transporter substrate-binding domain-containing protein [Desulfarculus sp.]
MKAPRALPLSLHLLVLLTLAACLLALPPQAAAQEARLRVVFTEWFPYTYLEQGRPAGFEIEIFQAVARQMNLDAEFVQYPWKRCLAALKSGEAHALISLLKTGERQEYTLFPDEHISISRTVFFTTAGKSIPFDGTYAGLAGHTIGVIAGFSYGPAFDQAQGLRKEEVSDAKLLIKKVLSGRNDLAAENQAVITGLARQMGVLEGLSFLEPPIHTQRLYVGFSRHKKLEGLCQEFSQALARFKQTPEYREILVKYGVEFAGAGE